MQVHNPLFFLSITGVDALPRAVAFSIFLVALAGLMGLVAIVVVYSVTG